MRKSLALVAVLAVAGFGQTATSQKQPATIHRAPANQNSGVDAVIELVKRGASEALVIKTLQDQGTAYKLSISDLVKLQDAGVSENIINVMRDPRAPVKTQTVPLTASTSTPDATKDPLPGGAGAAPAPPPPAETVAVTPFPPDLEGMPHAAHKRRVVVASFDYSAIKNTLQDYYRSLGLLAYLQGAALSQATDDVGQGIRAMIMSRLQQANVVTVLERNAAIDSEQQRGLSAQNDPATRAKKGHILGADCIVTGDITIFGRDDKVQKRGGFGGLAPKWKGFGLGGLGQTKTEEKAVVGLDFRIVDSETSEVIWSGPARGESTRESKTLGIEGLGIGSGGAAGGGFQNAMTSSNFQKTILGEATIDAVNQIVKKLEETIPQLPEKPRKIEGRVASIMPNAAYLALGSYDGVQRGDRFEIRQITNEVLDPQTKEVIDVQAAKVGELVVTEVHEKTVIGNYGGQALSQEYATGKGYQAILMSK